MTTEYGSEQEALEMGAFYGGYTSPKERKAVLEKAEISEIEMVNPLYELLSEEDKKKLSGLVQKVKLYTFPNKKGELISIGIGPFGVGFNLWLIDPKTGMSVRT